MYGKRFRIIVMLLALTGTLFTAGHASAAPSTDSLDTRDAGDVGTSAVWVPARKMTAVPANGRVSCYGYYGTFRTGTYVMVVDWLTSSDECFGIATDRTIWHAWPNSGGWKRMPGDGHADFIYSEPREDSGGARMVPVFATTNGTYWCQMYYPVTGWTGDWYLCAP